MPSNTPNRPLRTFTPEETAVWWDGLEKRMSSAKLFLETAKGQLLIVQSTYQPAWTLPGGIIDAGETPLQAVVREVYEELGLVVEPSRIEFVAVVDRHGMETHSYQFLFRTQFDAALTETIVTQDDEIAAWRFVAKSDITAGDDLYERSIVHWAQGDSSPYREQDFRPGHD